MYDPSVAKALALPARERGACCAVELTVAPKRAAEISDVLKALADPSRVQMILTLRDAKDPVCVCDFTAALSLSQPTVSHHMGRLREAGLVEATHSGIWTYYAIRHDLPERVRRIVDALA